MRKISKKGIGVVCFAVVMMVGLMGCDSVKEAVGGKSTEASSEATTEATTAAATESTTISQRTVSVGDYTDVSESYTITLPKTKGEWKTLDETLTETSIASDRDLIEIQNITDEEEVKKTLKEIPTLKKSFDKYIKKQKKDIYEDAETVDKKFTSESSTAGHWYFTFKIEDEVYNYVTFYATYTNDHVVMATSYTEGSKGSKKALEKSLNSIKLIDKK